ncbi:MAG TPA: GTP-sensing pleiotropic transcriptional regulator CodY [Anaerovoracaceae bacterium]|nr:GTP-sensing pleiotropic transcriptional regulator CodY [Anaerovoracaceae bacterium]
MDNKILIKFRKLNWVLSHSKEGYFSFEDLCGILSEVTDSKVSIISKKGKLLAKSNSLKNAVNEIDNVQNTNLSKVKETVYNLNSTEVKKIFGQQGFIKDGYYAIVPAISGEIRVGSIIAYKYHEEFSELDIALCEYSATVVGLEIGRGNVLESEHTERQKTIVRQALETLSYSELEAVRYIFDELDGDEGLLVASRIADETGITRSVIVNTLRKLESAGVIESRSLGMKGTRIKITNKYLLSSMDEIV